MRPLIAWLAAHTAADAGDAYRVESNPRVMQFLGGQCRHPKDQYLRRFATECVGLFPDYIAIRRKGDLAYIGSCALNSWYLSERGSCARVAAIEPRIVIDEPYWRDRYGVEVLRALLSYAFGPMGGELVAGVTDPRHPRMGRLCRLYGFRQDDRYDLAGRTWCESPELWVLTVGQFTATRRKLLEKAEEVA